MRNRESTQELPGPSRPTESLCFNGVHGGTGCYLVAPVPPAELPQRLGFAAETGSPGRVRRQVWVRGEPVPDADPKDLSKSGWGVVFAPGTPLAARNALGELLDHRREQASRIAAQRYQEYSGERAPQPGEDRLRWLARQGKGPGAADPTQVPYYLLLVGDPAAISFDFQLELATQYAVGRLFFDTPEEYSHYAAGVLSAERTPPRERRRVCLFGVKNPDDPATRYTAEDLIEPLFKALQSRAQRWELEVVRGPEATKEHLAGLLSEAGKPALLFTASHGMGFDCSDPRQGIASGALLCQDWPGPKRWQGRIPEGFYFAASDVPKRADLCGLIAFHFACFSAGVPAVDSFSHERSEPPRTLAPQPFLARLPQRLLGKPGGGALAVVGHVDRARGFSFLWPGAGAQPQVFTSTLQRLLDGHPVGSAVRYLGDRYADIATALATLLGMLARGMPVDRAYLSDLWTASIDARNYLVLGDPAVRLPVVL